MSRINDHYLDLKASYLFADISARIDKFRAQHPEKELIRMGIGDVTEPLPKTCRGALHKAVDEMGTVSGMRGYGPSEGYAFLREAIAEHDFRSRGCDISAEEIFVSDGSKCDTANIQEIFSIHNKVAVPDPVYPVYVDTNVMAGRAGYHVEDRYEGLVYLEARPDNQYLAPVPDKPVDLIYLCFPNNPTGAVAPREVLQKWVDYARESEAIIFFDAAYAAYIRNPNIPLSIFELEGARECAIEFRSFSKNAGFTGLRCAYTVVPSSLKARNLQRQMISVRDLWVRRHSTKFNGVSYPVQRAAEATYTEEGQAEIRQLTDGYMENAGLLREAVNEMGYLAVGGRNAPYIWVHVKEDSWKVFDRMLHEAGIVCTPGAGFGRCGEGHIRLSAFNSRANVMAAIDRLTALKF